MMEAKKTDVLTYRMYDSLPFQKNVQLATRFLCNDSVPSSLDLVIASCLSFPFSSSRPRSTILSNRYSLSDIFLACSFYIQKTYGFKIQISEKTKKGLIDYYKLPKKEADEFIKNRNECISNYFINRPLSIYNISTCAYLLLLYDSQNTKYKRIDPSLPLLLMNDFLFTQQIQSECDSYFTALIHALEDMIDNLFDK